MISEEIFAEYHYISEGSMHVTEIFPYRRDFYIA